MMVRRIGHVPQNASIATRQQTRHEAAFIMGVSSSISRFAAYYSRLGLAATLRRVAVLAKRALVPNRMAIFYCDLATQTNSAARIPSSLELRRLRSYAELSPQDSEEMTSFWNPTQAHEDIRERFEQRASLWLIKSDGKLAGYGWTLKGRTIEPHYFPLAQDDLHLFDFHVFPAYRGQGINPFLIAYILHNMTNECSGRAFIEAAEWNGAQLSSLRKTPFRRIGWARKSAIFHRTIVCWAKTEEVQQEEKDAERPDKASSVATTHEQ